MELKWILIFNILILKNKYCKRCSNFVLVEWNKHCFVFKLCDLLEFSVFYFTAEWENNFLSGNSQQGNKKKKKSQTSFIISLTKQFWCFIDQSFLKVGGQEGRGEWEISEVQFGIKHPSETLASLDKIQGFLILKGERIY